jgi:hypothetical protein
VACSTGTTSAAAAITKAVGAAITTAAEAACATSMAVAVVGAAAIIKAAALSSPPEVEVEEGERAMTTSLTAIAVGPPPAAAIAIGQPEKHAVDRHLCPPMPRRLAVVDDDGEGAMGDRRRRRR